MFTLRTKIPTSGIALGTAFVLRRAEPVPAPATCEDPEAETARFHAALADVQEELEKLAAGNDIFAAHLEMAGDPMLSERVGELIAEQHASAEAALDVACGEVCELLGALDDEYLRARVDDVRDVCGRIRRRLAGIAEQNPFAGLVPGTIVVAHELTPSDTALMDFGRITGFVTATGSVTSHVCIIARNKGIAAVVGAGDRIGQIETGVRLIVDGEAGEVIVAPDDATQAVYAARIESRNAERARILGYAHRPAVTPSGKRIAVLANAGSVAEVREALEAGAEGIGLFRSEFLHMQHRDALPSEQEQFEAYREAALLCGERPLIIRTLDIGGDKALPGLHVGVEENPFLGWRAIRISLAMPELFRTQLRALLRASAFGNLKIMFPMVTTLYEFAAARTMVWQCMDELRAEGVAFNPVVELGVMIETPAAVMIADMLAAEVRFFSIGTNDLTQYVMAADRGNARVAHLYDPYDQAVVRSIRRVLDAARAAGIEAGMCGELAGEERATALLLGLGLEEFSVGSGSIAALKERICTAT